jgi:hypothetical protein
MRQLDPRAGRPTAPGNRVGLGTGSGWDSGRTKLPYPRAPPMPSDAEYYGRGWERVYGVIAGRGGPLAAPLPRVSVNLLASSTTAVDRRSDKTRQEHLPMLRCPGLPGLP